MNELLIVDKQLTPEEKPSIKREMEIIEDDVSLLTISKFI